MNLRIWQVASRTALVLLVAAARASGAQESYSAPKFDYGEGKIDLLEAVRLTLAHDPNLLLSQEDVRVQQGVVGELSGAFDWVVGIDLSYDHREQELRQSVIDREREKRDDLSAQNRFACDQIDVQQQKIDDIDRALGGSVNPDDFSLNTDAFFQAQLKLFQERLVNATDPAEIQALLRSREALLNRERTIALGKRDVATFGCSETRQALDRLGAISEFEVFDTGKVSLRLDKLFRSGVGFSPFIDASYDHTQFPGKKNGFSVPRLDINGNPTFTEFGTALQRFIDFGGKNVEDLYKAEVGFDLNLPLLRGGGVDSTGAPERAASVDLEASGYTLRHSASISAVNTALAFWALLTAQERVAVLERSVALQGKIVTLTDELIAGDEVPRVERARALAGLTGARAQLESGKSDLVSARMALARTIGLDVASEANAPLAAGPFPTPPDPASVLAIDAARLAEEAVASRYDRRAARQLVDSGKILSEAARRDLRDRLDLSIGLSALALGEKSFSEAIDRWTGPSGAIAFAYEKQVGNRTAQGRLGQREALLRQRQISAGDLERNIRIGVVETLASLAEAIGRLTEAEASASFFQETVDAEVEKLRAGASTLVDTILTEQQKTTADLSVLAARQQVASLLAQLAFESGRLIEGDDAGGSVRVELLTQLPSTQPTVGGGLP